MVCSHPTGMCELAMPFNRSVVLWATTRFEQGRERSAQRLAGYVTNFRALAALPGSAVLANNMYDGHYTHYFTGVLPRYVPSLCAYPGVQWSWQPGGSAPVLVHGYRPHRGGVGLDAFLAPLRALAASGRTGGFAFQELRAALGVNDGAEPQRVIRALLAVARALRAGQPDQAAAALPAGLFRPGGAASVRRFAEPGPLPQAAAATNRAQQDLARIDTNRLWLQGRSQDLIGMEVGTSPGGSAPGLGMGSGF